MSQRSDAASFESIASSSPLAEIVDSASMSSTERAIVRPAVLPITARPGRANGSVGSGAGKDMLELWVDGEVEGVGQCGGVHRERGHRENLGDLGVRDSVIAQTLVVGAVDLGWLQGRLDGELDGVGAASRKECVEV